MTGDFHFLRPWWLLLIVPLALLVWASFRRSDPTRDWRRIVAPHLLPHLLRGDSKRASAWPIVLAGVAALVATVAIAGPTWRREPTPFADDVAPIAIVVRVAPSMLTEDVQPTRLARAVQKVHDLLAKRSGAKASLIAYAGTAHRVMPATTDAGIIDTFAQALDPTIMPSEGDAPVDALKLAEKSIDGAGSILWIVDAISPEQTTALAAAQPRSSIQILAPLPDGEPLQQLRQSGRAIGATVIPLTPDDADIDQLARGAKYADVANVEQGDRWRESGYWLTPLLVVLCLPFFQRREGRAA